MRMTRLSDVERAVIAFLVVLVLGYARSALGR